VAVQAQVPIVPVVVSSYQHFLNEKQKVFKSSDIIIEALPEISTEGLSHDDINNLMQKCRQLMIEKYNELKNEIKTTNPQSLLNVCSNLKQDTLSSTY
jgi:lysophosphatidate acyltransferase